MTLEAFGFETAEVVCASMVNAFAKMLGMAVLVTSSVVPMDCSGAGYCFNGVWEKLHQFFFDSCHTSQFIIVNGIHFQADQTMQMVILKDFASHSASFGLVLGAN